MKTRKRGKKALSGVVVAILITFLAISAIVIVYAFVIPMIQESSKKVDVNILTNNLELVRSSIVFNDSLTLLNFHVNKIGEDDLSSIKALILVNGTSLSYNLLSVPKNLESGNYVLNITVPGKIEQILIYPIFSNGQIGIGQKEQISAISPGKIDENLAVINPEKKVNLACVSNWECANWSKCIVLYNLNNLISNEIILIGEETRVCHDKNLCNPDIIERKECDDKATVTVKKVLDDGKEYVEVYDIDNKLISRLEYIQGGVNQLNIEFPFE